MLRRTTVQLSNICQCHIATSAANAAGSASASNPVGGMIAAEGLILKGANQRSFNVILVKRLLMTRPEWIDRRKKHNRAIGYNPRDNTTKEFYEEYIDKLGLLEFYYPRKNYAPKKLSNLPQNIYDFVNDTRPVDYGDLAGQMSRWEPVLDEVSRLTDQKMIRATLMAWSRLPMERFACFAARMDYDDHRNWKERKIAFYKQLFDLLNSRIVATSFHTTPDVIRLVVLMTKFVVRFWPNWILRHGDVGDLSQLTTAQLLTFVWCYRLKKDISQETVDQFQRELLIRFDKLKKEEIGAVLDAFNRCRVTQMEREVQGLVKSYADVLLRETLGNPDLKRNIDWSVEENIFEPLLRVGVSRLASCHQEIIGLLSTFSNSKNKNQIPIQTLAYLCMNFGNCGVFDLNAAEFCEEKLMGMNDFAGIHLEHLTEIVTFIYGYKFEVNHEILRKMEALILHHLEPEHRHSRGMKFSLSMSRVTDIMLPCGYHPDPRIPQIQFDRTWSTEAFGGPNQLSGGRFRRPDMIEIDRIEVAAQIRQKLLGFELLYYQYPNVDVLLKRSPESFAFRNPITDGRRMEDVDASFTDQQRSQHQYSQEQLPELVQDKLLLEVKSVANQFYGAKNVHDSPLPLELGKRAIVIKMGQKDAATDSSSSTNDYDKEDGGEIHEKLKQFVLPSNEKWMAILLLNRRGFWMNRPGQLRVYEHRRLAMYAKFGYDIGVIHVNDLKEALDEGRFAVENLLYSTVKPAAQNSEVGNAKGVC